MNDSKGDSFGYIETKEEFSADTMTGREICMLHKPEGLQYLQCHPTTGTIMPIQYSMEYRDENNQSLDYHNGIHHVVKGQTAGSGMYSSQGKVVLDELKDGTILVGNYDYTNGKKLVMNPELGVSSIEEYLEMKNNKEESHSK